MKRFISFALLTVFLIAPVYSYNYTFDLDPFFTGKPDALSLTGLQESAPEAKKPGLNRSGAIVLGTEAVLITGIMTSLYVSWYSGSETGGFHFYNDNREWLQMDKAGHGQSRSCQLML